MATRKRGAQPGNHNGKGAPVGSKRAEKYGFFSKYLPEETLEIIKAIDGAEPLDLLWHNIQLQYAAIIRAQRIAYVKDQQDATISPGDNGMMVQQAWDKQAGFLKAQARAMDTLRGLIKQYEEIAHANYDLQTEEQQARINAMKARLGYGDAEMEDDGFLDALKAAAAEDWGAESGI